MVVESVGHKCIKCGAAGSYTSLETSRAWFCESCYRTGICQKFRAALSSTKLFRPPKPINVLVVGEAGSRLDALLSLVRYGMDPKRGLVLSARVFIVNEDVPDDAEEKDGFQAVPLSFAFSDHLVDVDGVVRAGKHAAFRTVQEYLPKNAALRDEFKRLCFDLLCNRLAEVTNTPIVLTTENAEVIAQKTLSTLCFGRAASLPHFTAVLDERFGATKVIRPLRNITNQEIQFLSGQAPSTVYGASVSAQFLENVTEQGYPGTCSTILSVASKLCVAVNEDAKNGVLDKGLTKPIRSCWVCFMPASFQKDVCAECNSFFHQVDFRNRQRLFDSMNHGVVVDE